MNSNGEKTLIIGAAGFVGVHLMTCLSAEGRNVSATKLSQETIDSDIAVYDLDILDADAVRTLFEDVNPGCVFHLAAQSSVALSWKEPALTVDINIKGAVHVLEAARAMKHPARVLLIGSSEEYGAVRPEQLPVDEETPLRPGNIYAATKAAQDMLGAVYANAYGMDVLMIRAFNHIGPGQSPMFAVSDFCRQVARIESGLQEPIIRVGNLSAKRDFTDVRDVVRAYSLLSQRGEGGTAYNVGSGCSVSIQSILDIILAQAKADIRVERDETRFRPADVPVVEADTKRLRETTGWRPEIPVSETIADALAWWRMYCRDDRIGIDGRDI
ncbi:MAG: GDP-mannose 4,6-dehydratase [Gracilibacteraceae bacterium]|jgi:GDP-4-dehydro-6-deoxy-D-mannose reductase|nr:GDP-mannose 4,6-dehydratase [Gracilibacteraceae bacterium]